MRFDLKLVYTMSCSDAMLLSFQVRRRATIYVSCHLMSWKENYCLDRTDPVRLECLAELIRFIRRAIPNAPSQCCTGQESAASYAAAACCIDLLG
jgi:folylpolyglutamate synthase/dihydropteroate synthase